MEYLEILDAAAVPELQRLYGTDKEERANEILYYFARRDEESRRHLTLSSYRAEKALKAHPPTAPQNSEEERPFDTDDYPEVYETPTEVDEWWMR